MSIWHTDETLIGTTTPDLSGPGSNENERILLISLAQLAGTVEYSDCTFAEE